MSMMDTLSDVKATLHELKRKYRFRRARIAREDAVKLQATLAQCRGKLEICRKDFDRAIRTQCDNIKKGTAIGADTVNQQRILEDAAVGYMLVKDAIYQLESLTSYDSVAHAYEMLDAALKQMSGKAGAFPNNLLLKPHKDRNSYGYITSGSAIREKEELLQSFIEELKMNGNIEACLKAVQASGVDSAARSAASGSLSDLEKLLASTPDSGKGTGFDEETFLRNRALYQDIRPVEASAPSNTEETAPADSEQNASEESEVQQAPKETEE